MTGFHPPNYIAWSTDELDLSDLFQFRWYIQQVLAHGRAADVRALDLKDVIRVFDEISLPADVRSLWQRYLENVHADG